MSRPIFVCGHKCPDTDSIAAAIAYAYLQNQIGNQAEPIRAGELNKETSLLFTISDLKRPGWWRHCLRRTRQKSKRLF